MALSFYNTLTRKKEIFSPIKDNCVHIYSCGPTVYNSVHIGNLRAFLFSDTLQRWFRFGLEYDVKWIMNITDIDDKTIRDSIIAYPNADPKEALRIFTEHYADIFFQDLEKIGVQKSHFLENPFATHYIPQMQSLIQAIVDNGYAYRADDSIYLDVQKYKKAYSYGRLIDLPDDESPQISRIENDEYEKSCAHDFVLWKGKKEGEPFWDFTLTIPTISTDKTQDVETVSVPGRPGWHIECSAMSKSLFPEFPFDIHTGGVDLCFPHHENEICQAMAGYDTETANYWLHNEHLMVDGKKMSKSLGNFYTLSDLEKKNISPEIVRFFMVSNHYGAKVNLSEISLEMAKNTLMRIRTMLQKTSPQNLEDSLSLSALQAFIDAFYDAMNDDLNVSVAISHLFSLLKHTSQKGISAESWNAFCSFVERVENVFGVSFQVEHTAIPQEIEVLLAKRSDARAQKNWELSDSLRNEISQKGWRVKDGENGQEVSPLDI